MVTGPAAPRLLALVPWDGRRLPGERSRAAPEPGWGAFEAAGARARSSLTRLDPAAGPGGVVARVLGPDGRPRPVAVRVDGGGAVVVDLPAPPLALAPRSGGGFWSLDADRVRRLGPAGEEEASAAVAGVRLAPAGAGGAWVIGLEHARLLDGAGRVVADHPWTDPLGSTAVGARLCRLDAARLVCLGEDGSVGSTPVPGDPGPFERLLHVSADHTVTSSVDGLVRHDRHGVTTSVRLAGAGLTVAGEPFVAVDGGDRVTLARPGAPARRLPAAATVLAVDGDRVLVELGARTTWQADGADGADGDDAGGDDELAATAWRADVPYPFAAGPAGSVLVASSGARGAVILALDPAFLAVAG